LTIKKIALLADVSIGTVDRVIHNRGRVSPQTAEKVRRIIKETEYRPNIHARHLSLAKDYTFAVLTPHAEQDCGYWAYTDKGISRFNDEISSFDIAVEWFTYDRNSVRSFKETAERVLQAQPDGILLAPVLIGESRMFCKNLKHSIPYVFFDSYLPETDALASISQNSYASGILSGKLMSMLVQNSEKIAVLQAHASNIHINNRIEGFLSFFREDKQPAVFIEEHLDEQESCSSFLDNLLKKDARWEGMFVANAAVNQVAHFFENEDISIPLIGYDLIEDTAAFLQNGIIDFLISQKPHMQVYYGLMILFRHFLLKQDVSKEIIMPIDILTKENIDFYS